MATARVTALYRRELEVHVDGAESIGELHDEATQVGTSHLPPTGSFVPLGSNPLAKTSCSHWRLSSR